MSISLEIEIRNILMFWTGKPAFDMLRQSLGLIALPVCDMMARQSVTRVRRYMEDRIPWDQTDHVTLTRRIDDSSADSLTNILGGIHFTHAYS